MQRGHVACNNEGVYECDVAQEPAYDALIAANIRAARARLGITQAVVAQRMKTLGFSWYAQTCGAVERNERPLGADELTALALVLETTTDVLALAPPGAGPWVVFPSGQRIPAQRLSINDESVTWQGADVVITTTRSWPGIEVRLEKERRELAAKEQYVRELRSAGSGEGLEQDPGQN